MIHGKEVSNRQPDSIVEGDQEEIMRIVAIKGRTKSEEQELAETITELLNARYPSERYLFCDECGNIIEEDDYYWQINGNRYCDDCARYLYQRRNQVYEE